MTRAILVLLAGCSIDDSNQTLAAAESTTVIDTSVTSETTTSRPTATEPDPAPDADPIGVPVGESEEAAPTPESVAVPEASARYDLPADLVIDEVALGGGQLVALGYFDERTGNNPQGALLWSVAAPLSSATSVDSLFADVEEHRRPFVTSLQWFQGMFYAFTAGDVDADPIAPTVLTSVDGISWERRDLPAVQRASLPLLATPPSPPYEGASGVLDATVDDDGLIATGWATVNAEILPVIWGSSDGKTWWMEVVEAPAGSFGPNYGREVARGRAGLLVDLGGGTHYGSGTALSSAPAQWSIAAGDVPPATRIVVSVGVDASSFYIVDNDFDTGGWLRTSTDGSTWTTNQLPAADVDVDGSWNWSIHASGDLEPVLFSRPWSGSGKAGPVSYWLLRDRGWIERHIEGDRIVDVDDDVIVSATSTELLVHGDPRR